MGEKNSYDVSLIFLNVKSNFYFLFLLVTEEIGIFWLERQFCDK